MSQTPISNKALIQNCKDFVQDDPTGQTLEPMIKVALKTAIREINEIDEQEPLGWNRQSYDELFTKAYCEISAITAAAPGVITAESVHEDLEDEHGLVSGEIVWIDGIYGMDRLNRRLYRVVKVDDDQFSLLQLDGTNAINTDGYDAYTSGGHVYSCGMVLTASDIEPDTGDAEDRWKIKRVFDIQFDGYPADPITDGEVKGDQKWLRPGGRPKRWQYKRFSNAGLDAGFEHIIMWYPPCNDRYNVSIDIEKAYPDIASWTSGKYPNLPPEVHDCIWHRALHTLATNAEKAKRESGDRMMGKIEVLYKAHWAEQVIKDDRFIKNFSRQLIGDQPRSSSGWSA